MQPRRYLANDSQAGDQPPHDRPINVTGRDTTLNLPARDAAAQIVRQQIDRIYDNSPSVVPEETKVEEPAPKQLSDQPTRRKYDSETDMWQHYHNSWQDYYRQYYERYYLQQLHQQRLRIAAHSGEDGPSESSSEVVTSSPRTNPVLHNQVIDKVKERATKVRHSVHFMPLVSAAVVGFAFLFLQYNQLFIGQVKAYVSPDSTSSSNIVLDPTADTKVSDEPRLIVPKLNIDTKAVYGITSLENAPVQVGLREGVVHYNLPGANSLPGTKGNAVFLGHSTTNVFDDSPSKFVFVLLERLEEGDTFYLHYQGTRYTYSVIKKEVITPNQFDKLIMPDDKPYASLITCVPVGTALRRLIVTGEQISPDPSAAAAPEQTGEAAATGDLPGNSPSLLERLFGQ